MKCKNCEINESTKYSKYSSGEFCSKQCARGFSTKEKRGEINKRVSNTLKSKIKKKIRTYICDECKNSFEVKKYLRKDRKRHCQKCKRTVKRLQDIDSIESILRLSKRTVRKILKRSGVECQMCGWDKTSLDLHHIIYRKNGGTDEHGNLIPLCPNCHRMAHEGQYSEDELRVNTLEVILKNWKDYYNRNIAD